MKLHSFKISESASIVFLLNDFRPNELKTFSIIQIPMVSCDIVVTIALQQFQISARLVAILRPVSFK